MLIEAKSAALTSFQYRLFGVLLLLHLVVTLITPAGHFTPDSASYDYQARAITRDASFTIRNGYELTPHPSLTAAQTQISGNKLVSQYPEYWPLLAAPLYALIGFRAFFVLNSIAFVCVCMLVHRTTSLISRHTYAPLAATLTYALSSYGWEYSHSAYPHQISTLCMMAAIYLTVSRVGRPDSFNRPLVLAGLFLGVGIGMRLDTLFGLPGLLLPQVFSASIRWRNLISAVAGMLPPLAGLSFINWIKFGTLNPLSYNKAAQPGALDSSLSHYLPVVLAGLTIIAVVLAIIHRRFFGSRNLLIAGAVVGMPTLVWFGPALLKHLTHGLHGFYQIVVDIRVRDMDIQEPSLTRGADGAMIYISSVKKSLLQSCPHFALVAFTLIDFLRRPARREVLGPLFFACAGFIAFFGYVAWHGSIGLNMRYLNPALPCLSILAVLAFCRMPMLLRALPSGPMIFAIVLLWLAGALFTFVEFDASLEQKSFLFLTMPLLLSMLLLTAELFRCLHIIAPRSRLPAGLFLAAAFWASIVHFGHDYVVSSIPRWGSTLYEARLAPHVPANAVVLSQYENSFFGFIESRPDLIVFNPESLDEFEGLSTAMQKLAREGKPVYVYGEPQWFEEYVSRMQLQEWLQMQEIGRVYEDSTSVLYRGVPTN